MSETREAVNGSSHGVIVIWLDLYIGDPNFYSQLKAAFSSNIDPTNLDPVELGTQQNASTLRHNLYHWFLPRISPCELRTFIDSESCLECLRQSLDTGKRIYLITSDSLGSILLPHIIQQYPKLFQSSEVRISFYIFNYYQIYSLDWLYDCMNYMNYILVFDHEVDLLRRLVHDIAVYYAELGKILLHRDTIIDNHQARIYFEWANALCHHERRITAYQDSEFIQDLEHLIKQVKEKLEHNMDRAHIGQYSQDDLQRSLNCNIFIYYSEQFHDKASQLLVTLRNLSNEQGTLFDNHVMYVTKLQSKNCTIKQYCPIVISSNNDDRMKLMIELSSFTSIKYIYILDPSKHTNDAENDRNFLKCFSKVRNIYSDVKALALEWVAEQISICEKIGEHCTDTGNSNLARMYYEKAVQLNERLSSFIKIK